ncbi:hypothetical protein WMY93_029833 [Mugilogobius chulae]|uniref:Uncharacterized protein n=1 Tax=Mugilogobius chulae TaxID=88201 RepID=A0AAW0MQ52_9GOBI
MAFLSKLRLLKTVNPTGLKLTSTDSALDPLQHILSSGSFQYKRLHPSGKVPSEGGEVKGELPQSPPELRQSPPELPQSPPEHPPSPSELPQSDLPHGMDYTVVPSVDIDSDPIISSDNEETGSTSLEAVPSASAPAAPASDNSTTIPSSEEDFEDLHLKPKVVEDEEDQDEEDTKEDTEEEDTKRRTQMRRKWWRRTQGRAKAALRRRRIRTKDVNYIITSKNLFGVPGEKKRTSDIMWHSCPPGSHQTPERPENAGAQKTFPFLSLMVSHAKYMNQYSEYTFRSEGTVKPHWDWSFLSNIKVIRTFPAVLDKMGLKSTTAVNYMTDAAWFMDYFVGHKPKSCTLSKEALNNQRWELRKLIKDSNRTVVARQIQYKLEKEQRLVPDTEQAKCQRLAKQAIPGILDKIEEAPPFEKCLRYKFFGYLSAYFASIYGHRTGVFTKMLRSEVEEAFGDESTGYAIGVTNHTLTCPSCHSTHLPVPPVSLLLWRRRNKGLKYVHEEAVEEMGLFKPTPSFTDIRSVVATYNFKKTKDHTVRADVSSFMCHSLKTQERFYALHKTLRHAHHAYQGQKAALAIRGSPCKTVSKSVKLNCYKTNTKPVQKAVRVVVKKYSPSGIQSCPL